jgi:hypothetical protein
MYVPLAFFSPALAMGCQAVEIYNEVITFGVERCAEPSCRQFC